MRLTPSQLREIAMKILAVIIGTVMVLLPALHANAQFTGLKVADAKPGDVRVIATAAIRDPFNAVLKRAEAAIGKPIVAEYGSARGNLKDAILKGQDFEVALLLPDVDDEIQRAGKIAPDRFEIARVPVAFGLRGEAPNLDVSSPAAGQNRDVEREVGQIQSDRRGADERQENLVDARHRRQDSRFQHGAGRDIAGSRGL